MAWAMMLRLDAEPTQLRVQFVHGIGGAAIGEHAQPHAELGDAVHPRQCAQRVHGLGALGAFDFEHVGVDALHEIARRALGDDATFGEDGEAVAALGFVHVVRRYQDGGAGFGELEQALPEIAAALRIDRAGGLVEQQQFGRVQRRGGERQALPLAAAHAAGALLAQSIQPVGLELRVDARLQVGAEAVQVGR